MTHTTVHDTEHVAAPVLRLSVGRQQDAPSRQATGGTDLWVELTEHREWRRSNVGPQDHVQLL